MRMKAQGPRANILVAVTSFSVKTTVYLLTGQIEIPENKIRKSTIKWLHHNYSTLKEKTIEMLVLITFATLAYKVYLAILRYSILRNF